MLPKPNAHPIVLPGQPAQRICVLWAAVAGGLVLVAIALLANRHRFDWAFELIQIPAIPFSLGLCLAGLLIMPLPRLIERTIPLHAHINVRLLVAMIAVGLALRGLMFATEPVLEDDYHRYLWDGGVTAHGLNPYELAPGDAPNEPEDSVISDLTRQADVVFERINHPNLKTIYPPVAQAAFALAHWISPWSMTAWRVVCLSGELATLGLLLALLSAVGRSPLWAALYWWNPLIIKEMINSAHMEAVLIPLVLAAVLLAVRQRPLASLFMLGLAIGTKVWPVLLAPLLLRPLLSHPKQLAAGLVMLVGMTALWAAAPIIGGIDESSGFVAYAANWKTNSALFPVLEGLSARMLGVVGLDPEYAGRIVRSGSALIVGGIALWLARRPWSRPLDLTRKVSIVVIALFLLTPAQFPWYAAWMLPFLCLHPSLALLGVTVLLPLYYSSFYFHARDSFDIFRDQIVWLIWLPIWVGLAFELLRHARSTKTDPHSHA